MMSPWVHLSFGSFRERSSFFLYDYECNMGNKQYQVTGKLAFLSELSPRAVRILWSLQNLFFYSSQNVFDDGLCSYNLVVFSLVNMCCSQTSSISIFADSRWIEQTVKASKNLISQLSVYVSLPAQLYIYIFWALLSGVYIGLTIKPTSQCTCHILQYIGRWQANDILATTVRPNIVNCSKFISRTLFPFSLTLKVNFSSQLSLNLVEDPQYTFRQRGALLSPALPIQRNHQIRPSWVTAFRGNGRIAPGSIYNRIEA